MKVSRKIDFLILTLAVVACLILNISPSLKPDVELSKYETYEYYSERFSDDKEILDISYSCAKYENPVECVFSLIPMNYDFDRMNTIEPLFRTPEDYFLFGGVCRDYTLLRHSALENIGINCIFDFSEPRHVFLVCPYNDKFYFLDNGYYGEI